MIAKRKFICLTSGVLAYLTANFSSAAFIFKPKKEVKGIPKSWVDKEGVKVLDYARFILDLNLKNITPRMVLEPHFKSRRGVVNDLPPKKTWKNIKETLKIIDDMCSETGLKVDKIISAYRSPEYNRAVRCSKCSYHMQNNAVDVVFKNTSAWKARKIMRDYRDRKKKFKGGIGCYRSFTHIDTRGKNADW
jgi:hypothetical protein